jgi:hypothetical protein
VLELRRVLPPLTFSGCFVVLAFVVNLGCVAGMLGPWFYGQQSVTALRVATLCLLGFGLTQLCGWIAVAASRSWRLAKFAACETGLASVLVLVFVAPLFVSGTH